MEKQMMKMKMKMKPKGCKQLNVLNVRNMLLMNSVLWWGIEHLGSRRGPHDMEEACSRIFPVHACKLVTPIGRRSYCSTLYVDMQHAEGRILNPVKK